MPNIDGFELSSLIKSIDDQFKRQPCPIIAITAFVS